MIIGGDELSREIDKAKLDKRDTHTHTHVRNQSSIFNCKHKYYY